MRIVDSNFLQYGTTVKEKDVKKTSAGNLTDDVDGGPALTGDLSAIEDAGVSSIIKDSTITVGNIYTDKANVPGQVNEGTTHGLQIKDYQFDTDNNKVSSNKTATLTVNDLIIEDKLTGKVTSVSAEGIYTSQLTTENISTKAITLDGKDLSNTIKNGDEATLKAANAYTDTQIQAFGGNAARLNKRIDDVEETAYRGIAIALAAQQQIPNIGAGQFAVFGGVGHYEGESAGALGLAGVLADGRTSLSAALGAAGNGEVGGRLGIAYVFGGNR